MHSTIPERNDVQFIVTVVMRRCRLKKHSVGDGNTGTPLH